MYVRLGFFCFFSLGLFNFVACSEKAQYKNFNECLKDLHEEQKQDDPEVAGYFNKYQKEKYKNPLQLDVKRISTGELYSKEMVDIVQDVTAVKSFAQRLERLGLHLRDVRDENNRNLLDYAKLAKNVPVANFLEKKELEIQAIDHADCKSIN